MWMIATRDRPEAMRDLIVAVTRLGDVPPTAVMVDLGERQAEYRNLPWPEGWAIHYADDHLELSRALNELLALHPGESWYGMMTDHARPLSTCWSERLARDAGAWGIACSDDRRDRKHPVHGWQRLTGAIAFGGELVRTVGWLWLPDVVHLYGDDAWELIGHRLGILKLSKAVVDDLLVCEGQFPKDGNSQRVFLGAPYTLNDQAAYRRWMILSSGSIISRVRKAMTA